MRHQFDFSVKGAESDDGAAKRTRPISEGEARYQSFVAGNYLKLACGHMAGIYPAQ